MEKFHTLLQTIVLLLLCLLFASSYCGAESRYLVEKGQSTYTILISHSASLSEKHAAEELSRFLFEVTGARLPIEVLSAKLPQPCIALGYESAAAVGVNLNAKNLGDDGFTIKTSGDNLVIAGGKLRGTMYGVYTFLEDVAGCRWYTPFVSKIPKKNAIKLPDLNTTQKPDFEYRTIQSTDLWEKDWAPRNKVNGPSSAADADRGGTITYGRFAHTFSELVPTDVYFKDHPEYYSLVDGKRIDGNSGQLCLSNPEVLKIATATVLRWLDENPNAMIWSVSQNDNEKYCQCEKCTAIATEEGGQSGLLLRFVNAIAAEVAKKNPKVLIDTLAYNYTQTPPKLTKPAPNVRVRLCVFDCVYHPFDGCQANAPFMKKLREWGKLSPNMYIWQYTTVFTDYLLPLPEINKISKDIPMYKQNGVKGVFSLGSHSAGFGPAGSGGFMDNLKSYMLAKLLWNSKIDSKAMVHDYLEGFFGKASGPIEKYLYILEKKVENPNLHGWCGTKDIFDVNDLMPPQVMAESEKLFDQAEKLADNPAVLARVKHARLSIEYVKVMREVTNAIRTGTPDQKSKAAEDLKVFVGKCTSDGITQLREGEPIASSLDRLTADLMK